MTIRPATVDDAAAIAEINILSWRATYVGIIPQAELDAMNSPDLTQFWSDAIASPEAVCSVACARDGEAVGFIFGSRMSVDEDVPVTIEDGQSSGFIRSVHILESAKKSGLGRRLMATCARQLDRLDVGKVWLEVAEKNTSAKAFYDRLDGTMEKKVECGAADFAVPAFIYAWPSPAALLQACEITTKTA